MDKEIIAALIIGGTTIMAALIGLLGIYRKRQRSDQRKFVKSHSSKGHEQEALTDKTANITIPGLIPRDQLPEFRTAESVDALRESTDVRQLSASENQLTLWELPNGVFGYIEAYKIDTPSMRMINESLIEENFSLNKNLCVLQKPILGDFVEIHKDGDGQLYLVGFVTEEDRIALQNPVRSEPIKIVVSLKQHEKRSKVIAIPRERLEWWRHRQLGDGECIGDVRLS